MARDCAEVHPEIHGGFQSDQFADRRRRKSPPSHAWFVGKLSNWSSYSGNHRIGHSARAALARSVVALNSVWHAGGGYARRAHSGSVSFSASGGLSSLPVAPDDTGVAISAGATNKAAD